MILETTTTLWGMWALRSLAHRAILRGLRAPRLSTLRDGRAGPGRRPGA